MDVRREWKGVGKVFDFLRGLYIALFRFDLDRCREQVVLLLFGGHETQKSRARRARKRQRHIDIKMRTSPSRMERRRTRKRAAAETTPPAIPSRTRRRTMRQQRIGLHISLGMHEQSFTP